MNRFWQKTSLSVKISLTLLALLFGTVTLVISTQKAMAASLKSVSVITGDVLTLGDIFEGVTHNANYVIGPAPQPGKDMTLNARTLYRIATALDLSWRPTTANEQIIIRREASIVSFDDIERTLKAELADQGAIGNFNLALNSGKPSIVLSNDLPQSVEVQELSYNRQKDYFTATLVAPSRDNPVRKINVSGMVERLVEIPVLTLTLQNGDIINERDIQMIEVPAKNLQHDLVIKAEDLIGMTPRRIVHGGKFILSNALQRPELVSRGEKVNITFREGPLLLSAKGKALESGAKGDRVKVTNLNSNRTIDAIITGDDQVVVR